MHRIAASILSADFACLGQQLRAVLAAGADTFVGGSVLFGAAGYAAVIGALRRERAVRAPATRVA